MEINNKTSKQGQTDRRSATTDKKGHRHIEEKTGKQIKTERQKNKKESLQHNTKTTKNQYKKTMFEIKL